MGDLDPSLLALTTRREYQDAKDYLQSLRTQNVGGLAKPTEPPKPQEQPGLGTAVGYGLMRGTYGLGAEIGGVLGTVGTTLGSDTIAEWGNTAAEYWQKAAEALPKRDPRTVTEDPSVLISPAWWAENVAEALPGFAAFLLPSLGAGRVAMVAGKALKLTPKMVGKLAWIGQKVSGPSVFAAQEMGGVYNEVRQRGGSESDAARVATEAAFVAAGLGAINLHYLLGEGGAFTRRAARGAVSNTIISFLAEGSRGTMLGDDVMEILKNAVNQAPVQAALGAGTAALTGTPAPKKPAKQTEIPGTEKNPVPATARAEQLRKQVQEDLANGTLKTAEPLPPPEAPKVEQPAAETAAPKKEPTPEDIQRTEQIRARAEEYKRDQALQQTDEFKLAYGLLTDGKTFAKGGAKDLAFRTQALEAVKAANGDINQIPGLILGGPKATKPFSETPAYAATERVKPAPEVVVWGHDTVEKAGKLILGANDAEALGRIKLEVEAAEGTGQTARVVDTETGNVEGYRANKSGMPEWAAKQEGDPGYKAGETVYNSREDVLQVVAMIERGEKPADRATNQQRIFDRIFQQLKTEKGGPGGTEVLPAAEPTLEQKGTDLMASIEKLAAEERAAAPAEEAPRPTEQAPESTITPEAAPEAPVELTPAQKKYLEMAETGFKPEVEVEAKEYWPGMKSVRVTDDAKPFLEGMQQEAVAEAGRQRQARGVQADDKTAAKAAKLIERGEMTPETLYNAKPGTTWNAEQGWAAISILQTMANRVVKLAELSRKEGSGVSTEQAEKAWNLFQTAAQAVSAVATETGRNLRIYHGDLAKDNAPAWILSNPEFQWGGNLPPNHPWFQERSVGWKDVYTTGLSLGQGGSAEFRMQQLAALPTKQQQQGLLGLWSRLGRAGMELFYGSLLTPLSIARNAIAIPATIGYHVGITGAAEAGRRFAKLIAPDRVDEARGMVEGSTAAAWNGLQQGLTDAWRLISDSWTASREVMRKEGVIKGLRALDDRLRMEGDNLGPLSFERMRLQPDIASEQFPELGAMMGGLVDVVGLAARLPGMTGLTAGDIVSKIVNDRIGIAMKANEMARAQGYTGQELVDEVARLIRTRPPEIDKAGVELANKNTFTGEDGIIGAISRGLSHPLCRLFVSPFTRTPLRIMEYTLEGTPLLQQITRGWWQDVRGADPAKRDLAFAKMAVGWSMFAVIGGMAANGFVTGTGPKDPRELDALRQTGWQPLSFNFGGSIGYVSFAGMEPLSSWMGMAADFANRAAELPEKSAHQLLYTLAISAGDNLMVKRYMEGFSDLIKIPGSNNPKEQIKALQSRLMLPMPFQGNLGLIRRELDPQIKDARTVLDHYLAQTPGWSELVPPRRNIITGEIQRYQGAWGPDFISPLFSSTDKQDRVLDEIARLRGAGLTRVPEAIGGPEEGIVTLREPVKPFGVTLPDKARERWTVAMTQEVKLGGRTLHQALDARIGSPAWQTESELGKLNIVRTIFDQYKTAGKQTMLREFPEIAAQVRDVQRQRDLARLPLTMQGVR